jgi:hypothetical protein
LIAYVGAKEVQMEYQERRNYNRFLFAAVIILLVTVGVLLWLLLRPVPEPESTPTPTGNVDVFDIRIGVICRYKDGVGCYDDEDDFVPHITPGGRWSNSAEEKKINGKTDTDIQREGIVYVDDKNGRYAYQKSLKIFENPAFEYTNKIAPGVSNSYDFKIHNETENAIRYNIQFAESSEYAINMLYRLKREGNYIVGNDTTWVKADELVSALKNLPMDSTDTYTLDWQWPYESGNDTLDTQIGESMTSEYSLEITINFEEA